MLVDKKIEEVEESIMTFLAEYPGQFHWYGKINNSLTNIEAVNP